MITVVRFRSRKGTCVIPMEHVLGVRLQAEVKPFPGQQADVAGMIEWSGATIPVLSVLSSEGKHVLLLSAKGGPFGLLVDEVLGVVQLADSQVQPQADGPPAGWNYEGDGGRFRNRIRKNI